VLTAGITIAMFFLGTVADKWGVRFALIAAFAFMLVGRALISAAPTILHLPPGGLWSALHLTTLAGIVIVVIGYGMYQPAAYAAVRHFTTPKTAAMGFAMLYALMNLGGWLPTFAFLLRDDHFLGLGISGTFWVYTAFTALALVLTVVILSRKTVADATARAAAETAAIKAAENETTATSASTESDTFESPAKRSVPAHMWLLAGLGVAAVYWRLPAPWCYYIAIAIVCIWLAICAIPKSAAFLARHPLADAKFAFFIFALIPVQTLFTYNWLILPQYISRAYAGWIGEYFEIASNANPLLVFVAVPIVTALTSRARVYRMMIIGTLVMAAPAFLLAIGPYAWTLGAYILIMTIGESMWQPRFLQYAAEIAPKGRTGEYMGIAQFPWFLTKMLVPALYSGWMLERYCPDQGPQDTRTMWLIFAVIAMISPLLLFVARSWAGKDFKTQAA
jgi:MFS family permease